MIDLHELSDHVTEWAPCHMISITHGTLSSPLLSFLVQPPAHTLPWSMWDAAKVLDFLFSILLIFLTAAVPYLALCGNLFLLPDQWFDLQWSVDNALCLVWHISAYLDASWSLQSSCALFITSMSPHGAAAAATLWQRFCITGVWEWMPPQACLQWWSLHSDLDLSENMIMESVDWAFVQPIIMYHSGVFIIIMCSCSLLQFFCWWISQFTKWCLVIQSQDFCGGLIVSGSGGQFSCLFWGGEEVAILMSFLQDENCFYLVLIFYCQIWVLPATESDFSLVCFLGSHSL